MKLHLGCGHNYMRGWVNVDGPKDELCYDDIKADIYSKIEDLKYPDNSIDEILMVAVFEHFPRHTAIMQLRKFYKWLKPEGKLTILVPDFWGSVKMLKRSKSPKEKQFWFRHLYGPQDTIQFGTHYDAFDVEKLKWMFSVVGFNKYKCEIIKRWPSIRFTGIKDNKIKSNIDAERSIVDYMANYEVKDENGKLFHVWMNTMGIKTKKPHTPTFKTHEMFKQPIISGIKSKLKHFIFFHQVQNKKDAELSFWKAELKNYISWYEGNELYGVSAPREDQKIKKYSLVVNATTTWLRLFQERKYLHDLQLNKDSLKGMRVLDVGCGPFPNLLVFDNCERHGVDPSIEQYKLAGYPLTLWEKMGFIYHNCPAEKMPFPDHYFDAVVSVNAIDHVDDFAKVALEINRVLKPNGFFRMHVHYHHPKRTEPIEINDKIFWEHYGWVPGQHKIYESRTKDCGLYTCPEGELYVLWGNK